MDRSTIPSPLQGKSTRNKTKALQSNNAKMYPQGYFKPKKCRLCSKEFSPTTPSELYCSDSCKDDALSNAYLMRLYNITLEDYKDMYIAQNGLCKICKEDGSKRASAQSSINLVIDHDHKTGGVRGLLCHTCNSALGQFQDSTDLLTKALIYLQGSPITKKYESTSVVRTRNDNVGHNITLAILEDRFDKNLTRTELMHKYSLSESKIRSIIELKTIAARKANKRYLILKEQSATTIPTGSTSQANGDGSGSPLTDNAEGDDIVSTSIEM